MFRIKEIISSKGETIKNVAERIDVAPPNLSNIVNGKVTPSIEMLQRIASALDVHISELFESPDDNRFRCPKCGVTLEIKVVE